MIILIMFLLMSLKKNLIEAGVERIEKTSHENKVPLHHISIEKFHDEALEELNNLSDEEFLEVLHGAGIDCKIKKQR